MYHIFFSSVVKHIDFFFLAIVSYYKYGLTGYHCVILASFSHAICSANALTWLLYIPKDSKICAPRLHCPFSSKGRIPFMILKIKLYWCFASMQRIYRISECIVIVFPANSRLTIPLSKETFCRKKVNRNKWLRQGTIPIGLFQIFLQGVIYDLSLFLYRYKIFSFTLYEKGEKSDTASEF